MEDLDIGDKIVGWTDVLDDKCNFNELVDVTTINMPQLDDKRITKRDFYCYASFLPPGYHQLIIYDP